MRSTAQVAHCASVRPGTNLVVLQENFAAKLHDRREIDEDNVVNLDQALPDEHIKESRQELEGYGEVVEPIIGCDGTPGGYTSSSSGAAQHEQAQVRKTRT